jgi:hypothetical protein
VQGSDPGTSDIPPHRLSACGTGANGAVRVPPAVREGLEAVRLSGLTNMLDRPAVARIAYDAAAGTVEIDLRPSGIQALAEETEA